MLHNLTPFVLEERGLKRHFQQTSLVVVVRDVFFYFIPSFFFSKGAEAELGELIELLAVDPRYVVVKDLNQKSSLYPMVMYLFDYVLKTDPGTSDREKWKNLNLDVSLVAPSAWVDSLGPVLLDEDASSSKRFLLEIARDSF
ncbi:hypothetical protein Tco_0515458 [Tanacetum coccineum]